MFGKSFFTNAAFVFTHWKMDKKTIEQREKNQKNETFISNRINQKIISIPEFQLDQEIKCFFIDNELSKDDEFIDSEPEE